MGSSDGPGREGFEQERIKGQQGWSATGMHGIIKV